LKWENLRRVEYFNTPHPTFHSPHPTFNTPHPTFNSTHHIPLSSRIPFNALHSAKLAPSCLFHATPSIQYRLRYRLYSICPFNALSRPVAAFRGHGHTFIPPPPSTCLKSPLMAFAGVNPHIPTLNLLTPRAPPCYPPIGRGVYLSLPPASQCAIYYASTPSSHLHR